jgi:hypothetical protein
VDLHSGQVLGSIESGTTVVVLDFTKSPLELLCEGAPLVPRQPVRCSMPADGDETHAMKGGQYYLDHISGLRVRCIAAGPAVLCDGRTMLEYTPRPAQTDALLSPPPGTRATPGSSREYRSAAQARS